MDERERELLTGMGNCYAACGADFAETLAMVAGSRGRTEAEVRSTLSAMAARYGADPEYRRLRGRLPADFPF